MNDISLRPQDLARLPVAVLGAGPVGLAAAAKLLERGIPFIVLEAAHRVGANLLDYGHVRLFSPWQYDVDPTIRSMLEAAGWKMPALEELPLAHEVVTKVLQPFAEDYEAGSKTNAMSCVLRISNGAQVALLTGDIEQPQEARLVANSVRAEPVEAPGRPSTNSARTVSHLKSDLLLVPHHGSKTSSSGAFLDAVQPRFAIVQAGYRNRFGHPAEGVMARYEERQIRVFDSPHCGAATWASSRPDEVKCQRQEALRYWHHRVP